MKTVTRQTGTAVVMMAVLVLAIIAGGCATKRDVADIRAQLTRIEQQSRESSRLVAKIDSLIEISGKSNDALRSEIRTTIGGLDQQIAQLLENYQELVRQVNAMNSELHSRGVLRGSVGDATFQTGGTSPQGTTPPPPPPAQASASCDSVYDTVFILTLEEDYEHAIDGFRAFLADCSTHSNVPDAYFWIGECYFRMDRFDRAISEFEHVVNTYASSPKLVPALYKVGRCNQELGRTEEARAAFERIVNEFPNEPEASQARDRLNDL